MTIALLYLLGRMPEEAEEAYEIHLLECPSCLARAEAVEQVLRFRGCFQGEIRDMRDLRRMLGKEEGVVIPFHAARAGLWAAQREWMQTTGPLQRVASRMVEELDRAERDLEAVEAALEDPHPGWR
ncbi:MAG: hypothetical protein ACJ76J_12005 [Thermoanaerobaculia bacterium]